MTHLVEKQLNYCKNVEENLSREKNFISDWSTLTLKNQFVVSSRS